MTLCEKILASSSAQSDIPEPQLTRVMSVNSTDHSIGRLATEAEELRFGANQS